jgi:hypothetical protein
VHTVSAQLANLQTDITVLQLYTKNRQSANFADMPAIIEEFAGKTFNAIEGLSLANANLISVNFPTVDLIDTAQRVAVQVTITADSTKIKKTIKDFEAKDPVTGLRPADSFDRLIIFGFCKLTRPKSPLPAYCELVSMTDIVKRLTQQGNLAHIEAIIEAIQSHLDYSRLHPWHDHPSLKIIISHLDRSAFNHGMRHERSIHRLQEALEEVNELLGKGTLNGKLKCKAFFDFAEEIQSQLMPIKKNVIAMGKLLNQGYDRSSGYHQFTEEVMNEIEAIRLDTLSKIYTTATAYSIPISFDQSAFRA